VISLSRFRYSEQVQGATSDFSTMDQKIGAVRNAALTSLRGSMISETLDPDEGLVLLLPRPLGHLVNYALF
jgi:hypothetical protein